MAALTEHRIRALVREVATAMAALPPSVTIVQRRHYRVTLAYGKAQVTLTMSVTASDHHAEANRKSDVRRAINQLTNNDNGATT